MSAAAFACGDLTTAPSTTKLTVAALDSTPVDHRTVRSLTYGLPPHVLGPLCAVDFREPPALERLLSEEFARTFQSIGVRSPAVGCARIAELTARRDVLAQELETRIAGERRASKELDARWQELDRLVRQLQEQTAALDDRRQAVEAALAETDARLRYRRLELNPAAAWLGDTCHPDAQSARGARCTNRHIGAPCWPTSASDCLAFAHN